MSVMQQQSFHAARWITTGPVQEARLVGVLTACLVAVLAAAGSASAEAEAGFPIIDGEDRAVIVGDWRIRTQSPPGLDDDFLPHYIERSTGYRPPTFSETEYDPQAHPYAIFVGRTDVAERVLGEARLDELDLHEYIIHVEPDRVILVGGSERAKGWAQYDLLRTSMGIQTYLPAEGFTIVPEHDQVRVSPGTRVELPAFMSRQFSAMNTNHGFRGQADIPYRFHQRFRFHHNLHNFITVEEYGDTNPEYFPERDGERMIVSHATSPGPCIANPEVVEIVIDEVREMFDEDSDRITVSLGMTDGGWCQCEHCRALDGPSLEIHGETSPNSNRYYHFLNQIAAAIQDSHPGRYIGVLGYSGAEYPPSFDVEPNIIPYLCYSRFNWIDPDMREYDMAVVDAWLERVDRIGVYEYLYGGGWSIPRLYTEDLAEFLRYVAEERPGSGFYAEIYSNHGLGGPKAWITEQLIWDPTQDPEALLAQWSEALFEEAAEPMKRYFELIERIPRRNAARLPEPPQHRLFGHRNPVQFELFLPGDMDELWALLDEARDAAPSTEVQERIEYFASTLKIADASVRRHHAFADAKELLEDGAPAEKVLAALLAGDREAPELDIVAYREALKEKDPTRFSRGAEVSGDADLMQRVVSALAWPAVHEALIDEGRTEPTVLRRRAREAIEAAAPSGWQDHPATRDRMDRLATLAERITVASRIDTPFEIDGDTSNNDWSWQTADPWFTHRTGRAEESKVEFAFAYDDEHLYFAARCYQDDLAERRRMTDYGASTWHVASIELFLNPYPQAADPDEYPYYQVIPGLGGGVWESAQHALVDHAVVDDGKSMYEIELKLSFEKMGFSPEQFPAVKMNMVRNRGEGYRDVVSWFVSDHAHADLKARGWLLFKE